MPKVAGPGAREQEALMQYEQNFFDKIDRKSALSSSGLPTFQAPESGFKGLEHFKNFDFSGDSIFESDLPAAGSDVPAFGNFFTDTLAGMESGVSAFEKDDAHKYGELKLHRDGTSSVYVRDPSNNAVEMLKLSK